MSDRPDIPTARLILVGALIALALALLHVALIDAPRVGDQMLLHGQIVTHTAPAPYQYRILQPLLVEGSRRLCGSTSPVLFLALYALIRWIATFTAMACLYRLLRRSHAQRIAVSGVLILCAAIPFTYWSYYYQPTSIIELAAFALALYITARRQLLPLALVVFFGAFNRETMVFVSAIWLLWHLPKQLLRTLAGSALLFLLWAVPFITLRKLFPVTENLLDVRYYVGQNLTHFWEFLAVCAFTIPWFAWFGRRQSVASEYRRLAAMWALWVALHFCTALWWEVRYYLPLVMANIPPLLSAFAKWPSEAPKVETTNMV